MQKPQKKVNKQSREKSNETTKVIKREETSSCKKLNSSVAYDPEKTASVYDQAIKGYEECFQQQKTFNYSQTSYTEQLASECEKALAEYGEHLQSFEQAETDFNASLKYIQGLQGSEREEYTKEWKEYLQGLLDTSKQLTNSIEESILSMTERTS